MNVLIITGGKTNLKFLEEILNNSQFEFIIAVDKGLEILSKTNIIPDYIIGDFDSVNKKILSKYENMDIKITYLKPEKDFTDTHMALKQAIKLGAKSITIIGGIGTRIDHTLGNIHILKEALENNVYAELIDQNNKIILINQKTELTQNLRYKYISIIPLTTEVIGITLKGFKYGLENATLKIGESIGISNEAIKRKLNIEIKQGIAILIYSKD